MRRAGQAKLACLTRRNPHETTRRTATDAAMFRFATVVRALALLAQLACAGLAAAQQAPLVGIEPVRAALDQIETQARRGGLGVRALSDLSQRLSPLREDLRDKLADLEPQLAD